MVRPIGLEPTSIPLEEGCSSIELRPEMVHEDGVEPPQR